MDKGFEKHHKLSFLKPQAYLGFNGPSKQINIELNTPSRVISPFGQRSPTGAGGQPGGCSQAGSVYFAKSGLDFLLSSPFSSFKALLALSWSLLKLSASMSEASLNFERGQLFFSLAWILQCCHKWADVWRLRKGFALCWLWFHVQRDCSCYLSSAAHRGLIWAAGWAVSCWIARAF